MKKVLFRKSLVLGVGILFIATALTPTILITRGDPGPDGIIWSEGFEDYAVGSFPSTWTGSGNAPGGGNYITDAESHSGAKALRLNGIYGGCWEALAHRFFDASFQIGTSLIINYAVKIGSHGDGCHGCGKLVLHTAPHWTANSRCLIKFDRYSDTIWGEIGAVGTYQYGVWYQIRVRYSWVSDSSIEVQYWLDGQDKGVASITPKPYESDFSYLTLTSGDGTTFYDDVSIEIGEVVCEADLEISGFYWSTTLLQNQFTTTDDAHDYISDAVTTREPKANDFGNVISTFKVTNNGNVVAKNVKINVKVDIGTESFSDRPYVEYTVLDMDQWFTEDIFLGDIAPHNYVVKEVVIPMKFASVNMYRDLQPLIKNYVWDLPVWITATGWVTGYVSADNAETKEHTRLLIALDATPIWELPADVLLWVLKEVLGELFMADLTSPSQLHLYDSLNRHTGPNSSLGIDLDIPDAYFIPENNNREVILLTNVEDQYTLVVEGTHTSTFDLNVSSINNEKWITYSYLDIPETENSIATIEFGETFLNHLMKIDLDGDGIIDEVKEPDIITFESNIDIDPDTLNSNSSGKWITCYIELPDGYDVVDINVSTILLNDAVPAESRPTTISDYDVDGIPDLMVKFDRQVVQDILEPGDDVAIMVTGELTDETYFSGIDIIRVI